MNLRVLLPFGVLLDAQGIRRIVVETDGGTFGFWPQRLDCAAALVPGILTYEASGGGERYLAIDRGVMVKTGVSVVVSVRNGISGGDLEILQSVIDEQFERLDEMERQSRSLLAKMESEMIREATRIPHV